MNGYKKRICRAVDFVQQNLARDFTVDEIAMAAGFSKFHFQRLFRAAVGESVGQFVRRLRLESAARQLVANPAGEITDVAIQLGFSSSQNFAKAFRGHFDCSPTEFRKRWIGLPIGGEDSVAGLSPKDSVSAAEIAMNDRLAPFDAGKIADQIEVRMMEPFRVVYHRHFGSYHDPEVQAAFDRLQHWATERGRRDPTWIGIPWDDASISPEGKCRFDACVVVEHDFFAGQRVNCHDIPAGRYAVYQCSIEKHDFERPWDELMWGWLPESGLHPASHHRYEVYLNDGHDDPDGRWELRLCLPVEPV